MDKHIPLHVKNRVLGYCLSQMSHEDIYVVPAVREYLDNLQQKQ